MPEQNALSRFEIPAAELTRAPRCYATVLEARLTVDAMGSIRLAIFPYRQPGVGGCVIAGDGYAPARAGTRVYLGVAALDAALVRAGGSVALARTAWASTPTSSTPRATAWGCTPCADRPAASTDRSPR
jgi:predicted enzyme related to lactoylglutathione lyase